MPFLTLKDSYDAEINVKVESIDSFVDIGGFRQLMVNGEIVTVQNTMDDIKKALSECYFTIKPVELTNQRPDEDSSNGIT